MDENMILCILVCVIVSVHGQGAHPPGGQHFDIQDVSAGSFMVLDTSPKDGTLSESEWDAMLDIYNANGDNCTNSIEYTSHTGMPNFVAKLVFNELDTDLDGCLTSLEMASKFRKVDKDGNDQISLAEYRHYYQQVFANIFAHMPHGPGH